jgi:hypothetical protein
MPDGFLEFTEPKLQWVVQKKTARSFLEEFFINYLCIIRRHGSDKRMVAERVREETTSFKK